MGLLVHHTFKKAKTLFATSAVSRCSEQPWLPLSRRAPCCSRFMLAALQPSHPASMTDYLAADAQPAQTLLTEDRVCPGCKKSVVDENGGVVVAFG